jgi:transposase-like protein
VARSGRRTSYSRAKADAVLEHVADGASLRAACQRAGLPRSTLLTWVKADRDALGARYERALATNLLSWLEDCRERADDKGREHLRRVEAAIIRRPRPTVTRR